MDARHDMLVRDTQLELSEQAKCGQAAVPIRFELADEPATYGEGLFWLAISFVVGCMLMGLGLSWLAAR